MNPLISVIVPVYNIENYVGLCIESIIKQTYANLEIILVDDGATDKSGSICDLYALKDPRIIVIHKTNGGLVSARKAGLEKSSGEYISYVDGDDWIEEDFIESLYSLIVQTSSDIVCAGYKRDLFNKSISLLNVIPKGCYENESLDKIRSKMISYGNFFRHGITTYVWNKLFKREILLDSQINVDSRITIGEDAAVTYSVLLKTKKVCISDNCSYHYRQREDSMLKTHSAYEKDAVKLKILNDYLHKELLSDKSEKYNLKSQISDFILSTYIIRSGGILPEEIDEFEDFPFDVKIRSKKIVVCGAGTFGQQLYKRISESAFCDIVGWVDYDYWEYRRSCINVDSLEDIEKITFDYVLIAVVDSYASQNMKNKLSDYGVPAEKILRVNINNEMKEKVLYTYLRGVSDFE